MCHSVWGGEGHQKTTLGRESFLSLNHRSQGLNSSLDLEAKSLYPLNHLPGFIICSFK